MTEKKIIDLGICIKYFKSSNLENIERRELVASEIRGGLKIKGAYYGDGPTLIGNYIGVQMRKKGLESCTLRHSLLPHHEKFGSSEKITRKDIRLLKNAIAEGYGGKCNIQFKSRVYKFK